MSHRVITAEIRIDGFDLPSYSRCAELIEVAIADADWDGCSAVCEDTREGTIRENANAD